MKYTKHIVTFGITVGGTVLGNVISHYIISKL